MPAGAVPSGDMFRDGNILTQICGNGLMVLNPVPPPAIPEAQTEDFAAAIREAVELAHASRSWSEAPRMALRAAVN
jgi:hypothetical protein